jgi:sulfur carrier protein
MVLTVNGERRQVEEGLSVAAYLAQLGLSSQRVAVERNRRIVPRSQHAEERMAEGDEIEIVTFVGGG